MFEIIVTQSLELTVSETADYNLKTDTLFPLNKRVLNICLNTPGGRAEFPSVKLYSDLKKLCEKKVHLQFLP